MNADRLQTQATAFFTTARAWLRPLVTLDSYDELACQLVALGTCYAVHFAISLGVGVTYFLFFWTGYTREEIEWIAITLTANFMYYMAIGLLASTLALVAEFMELRWVHGSQVLPEAARDSKCLFQARLSGFLVMFAIWMTLPLAESHLLMGAVCTAFGVSAILLTSRLLLRLRLKWLRRTKEDWAGRLNEAESRMKERVRSLEHTADRIRIPLHWSFSEHIVGLRQEFWERNIPDALATSRAVWDSEFAHVSRFMTRVEECDASLSRLRVLATSQRKRRTKALVEECSAALDEVKDSFRLRYWDDIEETLGSIEQSMTDLETYLASEVPESESPPADAQKRPTEDPYEILGLESTASDEEVNAAYRRIARSFHPDRGVGSDRIMQIINDARDQILRDRQSGKRGS